MVIANQEMAEAWEREAEGWLTYADRYDEAGRPRWERFLRTLDVTTEAHVLDIGCGGGMTTLSLARLASSGAVVGVDISRRMVEHARRRAAQADVTNVEFVHADAQVHPFPPAAFDLAVSSFGTMFFADPATAFGNLRRALRPGGSLAMLVWRALEENEWLTALRGALALGRDLPMPPPDAPGPFGLARESRVRELLGGAGFGDVSLERLDEPMSFGRNADDAFEFLQAFGVTKGLTQDLADDDRRRAMASLRALVEEHESPDGVRFDTSAWVVRATA